MNESNKNISGDVSKNISFARGNVSQDGYPSTVVVFVRPSVNRKDGPETQDKPLYVVYGNEMEAPLYPVTLNVLKALGRISDDKMGVMSLTGDLLIPMIYTDIKKISEDYFACSVPNTMDSEARKDPIKAQDNASLANDIKKRIKDVASSEELDFVCSDFYAKYDVYKIDKTDSNNIKSEKVCSDVSFVGVSKDGIYAHTNNMLDSVITIKESAKKDNVSLASDADETNVKSEQQSEQPKFLEVPAGIFTKMEDKHFDSLITDVPEAAKEDAPKMINNEGDNLKENEVSIKPFDFEKSDTQSSKSIFDTSKEDSTGDNINSFDSLKNVDLDNKGNEPKKVFDEKVDRFSFDEFKKGAKYEKNDSLDSFAEVPRIVGAVKQKLDRAESALVASEAKVTDLENRLSSADGDIARLKEASELKDQKVSVLEERVANLDRKNSNLAEENNSLSDTNNKLSAENDRLRATLQQILGGFREIIDVDDQEPQYKRVA